MLVDLQVCERLQRLTNLKHLAIGGFDMLLCSNADTLLALARALRSLTHFHLRRNPGGVEPYSSAAPFLHTVLPQLTQLRFMEVRSQTCFRPPLVALFILKWVATISDHDVKFTSCLVTTGNNCHHCCR